MYCTRMRRALADGLRGLVRRSRGEVPSVTGLRALSILWVLVQHVHQGLRPLLFVPAGAAFLTRPALRLGWAGNLGVDVFFVISGYLIGGMLLREREATGRLSLRRFYVRRAMRILPIYFLAIAASLARGEPNGSHAWANVIFVNDFLPFREEFMAHTWSLAIEEQFYALFPLFLLATFLARPSRRTPILAAALPACAAIAVEVVFAHHLVLSNVAPDTNDFWTYMDLFYVRPYARCTPLFAGVLVARLEQTGALARLDARPVPSAVLLLLGILAAAWVTFVFPEGRDAAGHRTLSGALSLALDGPLFGVGVATVLAVSLVRAAPGRVLQGVLGARALRPIARLSYAAYLFHPLCIAAVLGRLGFDLAHPALAYGRLVAASMIASFAAALPVYLLVELPIMKMRPPIPSTNGAD